jgi:hypothetical protein
VSQHDLSFQKSSAPSRRSDDKRGLNLPPIKLEE